MSEVPYGIVYVVQSSAKVDDAEAQIRGGLEESERERIFANNTQRARETRSKKQFTRYESRKNERALYRISYYRFDFDMQIRLGIIRISQLTLLIFIPGGPSYEYYKRDMKSWKIRVSLTQYIIAERGLFKISR